METIKIVRVETDLGEVEHEGQVVSSCRVDWLLDGFPVHLSLYGKDHSIRARNVEIGFVSANKEKPLFWAMGSRHIIYSTDGYNIDSVTLVTQDTKSILANEQRVELDHLEVEINSSVMNLLVVQLETTGPGGREHSYDLPVKEYLVRKAQAENTSDSDKA